MTDETEHVRCRDIASLTPILMLGFLEGRRGVGILLRSSEWRTCEWTGRRKQGERYFGSRRMSEEMLSQRAERDN